MRDSLRDRFGALLMLTSVLICAPGLPAQVAPGAPTNPRVEISADGTILTASWIPGQGSGPGVVFELEFRSLPGATVVAVARTAATSLTASILPGITGAFRFRVRGLMGAAAGPFSDFVDFTIGGTAGCLSAPNIRFSLQGDTLTVSWAAIVSATDYELHAGTVSGGMDFFAGRIGARTSISVRVPAVFAAYVRLYAVGACGPAA